MKILTITFTTINIVTLLMGNAVHTPTEIDLSHGIYPTTMRISATEVYDMGTETVEDDEGLITFVDGADNIWNYEQYPEDYHVGDYVAMIMDDNGTPNYIYDDIILDFRATGFWVGQ